MNTVLAKGFQLIKILTLAACAALGFAASADAQDPSPPSLLPQVAPVPQPTPGYAPWPYANVPYGAQPAFASYGMAPGYAPEAFAPAPYTDVGAAGVARPIVDVNQYTLGMEKTFWDGRSSIEVRLPFTSNLSLSNTLSGIEFEEGRMGNVAIIPKIILYQTRRAVLVGGCGVALPTAADVVMTNPADSGFPTTIRNESVHLLPFLGLTAVTDGRLFYNAFAQVDVGDGKNSVIGGPGGALSEASMLFIDASVGYWLYRDSSRVFFPAMAALFELHSSLVMEQGDSLVFATGAAVLPPPTPSPLGDLYTGTVGLHIDVADKTKFRIGYAVPLHSDHDGFFDSEIMVQLNRYF